MLSVLLALAPLTAHAQPGRLESALASLPDGEFTTHEWHADRSSRGFVYLLEVTGQPHGTVYQPFVRDLGVLRRTDVVRALGPTVAGDVVVDPIRNASGGVVAYVVRHRDVQVSPAFSGDGRYKIYVRVGETTESGGGGGAGGGGM